MKRCFSLLLAAAITMTAFNSCEKGDEGPMGNADVTVYNYGTQTSVGGSLNYTLTISKERIDSSLVLVYYNPSTESPSAWYPVPGTGSSGAFDTRYFIYQTATTPLSQYTLAVRLMSPGGTPYATPVTFTKLKLIIAPASTILAGGRTAQPYDVNDYNSVKRYFNLAD